MPATAAPMMTSTAAPRSRRPSASLMTGTPLLPSVHTSGFGLEPSTSPGDANAHSQLPMRHPRPLTAAELHHELEKEQEAVVNRLSRELSALRAQTASAVSNTSSSSAATADDGAYYRHRSSSSLSTSARNLNANTATSQASVDRARDAAGAGAVPLPGSGPASGFRSRQQSMTGGLGLAALQMPAAAASPSPGPSPAVIAWPDDAHRARAALEAARRENAALVARVRLLEAELTADAR